MKLNFQNVHLNDNVSYVNKIVINYIAIELGLEFKEWRSKTELQYCL